MSKSESSIKEYLKDKGHQNLVIGLVEIGTGAINSVNVPVTVASVCAEYMNSHLEAESGWISVEDRLPTSENEINQKEYDVWITDYRITNVIFRDNKFKVAIEDHDGDFSHWEVVDEVSFWMEQPTPPTQGNEEE